MLNLFDVKPYGRFTGMHITVFRRTPREMLENISLPSNVFIIHAYFTSISRYTAAVERMN